MSTEARQGEWLRGPQGAERREKTLKVKPELQPLMAPSLLCDTGSHFPFLGLGALILQTETQTMSFLAADCSHRSPPHLLQLWFTGPQGQIESKKCEFTELVGLLLKHAGHLQTGSLRLTAPHPPPPVAARCPDKESLLGVRKLPFKTTSGTNWRTSFGQSSCLLLVFLAWKVRRLGAST